MIHFTEYLDTWQPLNVSSVLVDSTISNFEAVHVNREISNGFANAKDYCLSGKKCFRVRWLMRMKRQEWFLPCPHIQYRYAYLHIFANLFFRHLENTVANNGRHNVIIF